MPRSELSVSVSPPHPHPDENASLPRPLLSTVTVEFEIVSEKAVEVAQDVLAFVHDLQMKPLGPPPF